MHQLSIPLQHQRLRQVLHLVWNQLQRLQQLHLRNNRPRYRRIHQRCNQVTHQQLLHRHLHVMGFQTPLHAPDLLNLTAEFHNLDLELSASDVAAFVVNLIQLCASQQASRQALRQLHRHDIRARVLSMPHHVTTLTAKHFLLHSVLVIVVHFALTRHLPHQRKILSNFYARMHQVVLQLMTRFAFNWLHRDS